MHIALAVIIMTCSWYGPGFHGNVTANGEIYDQHAMTAAHRELPFDTVLRLTKDDTTIHVRINDRGPYEPEAVQAGRLEPHPTRDLDLSKGAFKKLAPLGKGIIDVEAEVFLPGEDVEPPPVEVKPK